MLRSLRIQQFVIVEELDVEFADGLNLLTGETGAGKSILVDAIGLVLGHRADRAMIRAGAERASVEALFEIDSESPLRDEASTLGLTVKADETQVVIRREVPRTGTGRAFVNGSPVNLTMLRRLGGALLEVHGQHEQQELLAPEQQLLILDRFGGHHPTVQAVASSHAVVVAARGRLVEVAERARERDERAGHLERIVNEIDAVAPRKGELAELDRERHLLRNASRVTEILDRVVDQCYENERSAAALAASVAREAARLAELDDSVSELAARLDSAALELQDTGAALRDYRDRADFDPARLERLEERRVALERLCLAYGTDEEEVLLRRAEAALELEALFAVDREIEELQREVDRAEASYLVAASELSLARKRAARRLGPAVEAQLRALALAPARVRIEFEPARGASLEHPGGGATTLHARGAERVEFQLAANPGEPFRPLGKAASGGELSRIMLALYVVCDGSSGRRSLVFDEVDAGVGGAVADALGARLARLARRHQVLCVTHLPQVAAYANRHHAVRKQARDGRTHTRVDALGDAERVEELARMLGGKQLTRTTRQHASELIAAANGAARGTSRRQA